MREAQRRERRRLLLHAVFTRTRVKLTLCEKTHLFRYGSVVDGNVEVFLTRVQDRPLRPAGRLVSKHATKKNSKRPKFNTTWREVEDMQWARRGRGNKTLISKLQVLQRKPGSKGAVEGTRVLSRGSVCCKESRGGRKR